MCRKQSPQCQKWQQMPAAKYKQRRRTVTEHHSLVAHHFETLEQQRDASRLGMWTFLATEVLFFGGLFLAYVVYRAGYPDIFSEAGRRLNLVLGTINTVVLLTSSLTVALAVHAGGEHRRKRMIYLMLTTMALGLLFLGIKGLARTTFSTVPSGSSVAGFPSCLSSFTC